METMNCLIFNGYDLRNYAMYVSGDKTFDSPKKEYTKVSIPGRSGDLAIFDGRYSNVNLTYDAILIDNYEANAAAIRSILMSADGYCRLEDSYHPNEYRMALFEGPLNFDSIFLEAGETSLTFNCKPQRWLKTGEIPVDIKSLSTVTLNNTTSFASNPLIRVNGKGKIKFVFSYADSTSGEITIDIPSDKSGDYYIDCETMDCYTVTSGLSNNPNSYLTVEDFPVLKPGNTTITITKANVTLTNMTIAPRWYIL